MASVTERLAVDCSVVVKWKLAGEPHTAEAEELFLDWQHSAVEVAAPSLLSYEVMSVFLQAHKRGRISASDAADFLQDTLGLPFVFHELTCSLAFRAFEMALQHQQSPYDCAYLALAEREAIEFWTSDQRLHNALHQHYPFIRWIADYQRKRP